MSSVSTSDRKRTSLPQKLGLVVIGLFLTVLIPEAALRLGGSIILSRQAYRNALAMRQKGTYRIMCIGESTTAGEYPTFLEKALNGKDMGIRFSVTDRGIQGTNSTFLLSRMEADLETYHPDMVVTMMGINDFGPHMPFEPETRSKIVRSIRILRTYKLARIAWMRIASTGHRAKEALLHGTVTASRQAIRPTDRSTQAQQELRPVLNLAPEGRNASTQKAIKPVPNNYQAYVERGAGCMERHEWNEAIAVFQKALAIDPQKDKAYVALVQAYRESGQSAKAMETSQKALAINPKNAGAYSQLGLTLREAGRIAEAVKAFQSALAIDPKDDWAYVALGNAYHLQRQSAKALAALKKALEIRPTNDEAFMEMGRVYQCQGQFADAAAAFKSALEINPKDDHAKMGVLGVCLLGVGDRPELRELLKKTIPGDLSQRDRTYGALATLYAASKDSGLAKQYQKRAEELRLKEYDPTVADNYLRLKTMLDRRGVKLVCVQYPMRGLEPLSKIFQNQAEEIVFVDNEQVFKNAVKKSSLQEYFRDLFAGDFGHCTDKGNKLLADNIAAVLAREVFHR